MATFALLLNHAPDRYEGLTEDEYMAIIKDYIAWVEKASAEGIYKGGQKLVTEPGKVMRKLAGKIEVHDSPFAETSEILGGFMLIEAADYDAAVQIARAHPHFVHNTEIEIRQIDAAE